MSDDNKSFEKWAKKQGLDVSRDNHPNPRTLYWYGNTQEFWECWQAAQKARDAKAYCHCAQPDVRSNGQVIMCWNCGHAPAPTTHPAAAPGAGQREEMDE